MKTLFVNLLIGALLSSCAVTTSYDDKGNVTQTTVDPVSTCVAATIGILTYDPCYTHHYWSYRRPHYCDRTYYFRPYSHGHYSCY